MSAPEFHYDTEADAGYLNLHPTTVTDRSVEVVPGILIDIYEDEVVGVEFIGIDNLRAWLLAAARLRDITLQVSTTGRQ